MQGTAVEEEIEAPAGLTKPPLPEAIGRESWFLPAQPSAAPRPALPARPRKTKTIAGLLRTSGHAFPGRLQTWLAEENRFGHLFLFAPVAMGAGALLWFVLSFDPLVWPWILALLLAGGAALRSTHPVHRPALIGLALFLAGVLLAQAESWRHPTVILDSPVTTDLMGTVERSETAGSGKTRYLVKVQTTANPQLRRAPTRVSLISRSPHDLFEGGAAISGRVRLSPPSGPALPGLHDFAFSAYFDGTGAVGYFYGAPKRVDRIESEDTAIARAERWLFSLRAQIGNRIRATAPGDAGAFAAAIVTDERRAISHDTVEALRVSGLAHIVAISGLNMALAAGIFFVGLRTLLALFPGLAQALPVKKLAAAGALLMVTGYYLISGFGVSAQRAFIMMAVMLVAVLLDRPSISLRNVALSALIIIVWSPSEILGPSFQMSFAATTALVAGYAAWAHRVRERQYEPPAIRHPVVTSLSAAWAFIAGMIMTSLIGSLSTAMFSVEHFHRIAMYGLAANLAAMPIISFLVMPAGLLAMLLMPFGFDGPFILIMAQGLEWVIVIAKHVAGWGGDFVVGQQSPWFLPMGITGFLLLALLRTRLRLAGLPFLAAALVLFLYGSDRLPADVMISEDGTLVVLRNHGATLQANRTRLPSFIYDQWKHALRLPEPGKPLVLDREEEAEAAAGQGEATKPNERQQALPPAALAKAERAMVLADATRFTCAPRAWCAMRSSSGVLVVVVEDGRYAGVACDKAGLVVAPRSRFSSCRSGTPMLNGATLRKTGSLMIDFTGARDPHHWQVTKAADGTSRPWSMHRSYDWRRDVYDPSLPHWLTAQAAPDNDLSAPAQTKPDGRSSNPATLPPAHEEDDGGAATFVNDIGE